MVISKEYFEDLVVGASRETATKTVDKDEIIEFGREFDPQTFHIDEAAAKQSIFGGLIASGWHTAAMAMRLIVDTFVRNAASTGSPGFDNLRWLQPVRPGDVIRVRSTVVEKIPSKSRPNLGVVKFSTEVLNQRDEVVMSLTSIAMYNRRPNKT
ncbi:MAG TPA: MaoC family dehydratase [Candidatus Cybelea sp.]|nr:MaoC family dehydratase [Candidatus Cybelea sp.]